MREAAKLAIWAVPAVVLALSITLERAHFRISEVDLRSPGFWLALAVCLPLMLLIGFVTRQRDNPQ